MNKEMLKKLKMGVISFAAVGVLAACATDDGVEEQPVNQQLKNLQMIQIQLTTWTASKKAMMLTIQNKIQTNNK